ncbi:MAG: efflux RND transporter permease subunit [Myxococcales bacterium]|nr:efflux RND transporter permease subunit [Myxococcales bacterium]
MTLAETAVRRPVFATVLSLVLVIFGVVGFSFLGVREYPAVDPPVVTVTTTYPGANPDVVDSQITEPLEQALSGIPGVRTMSSTSRDGTSAIRLEFDLSVDLEAAANDVRDKVSGAVGRLPIDADPPVVEKADADSSPVVFLTVRSDTKDILEVSNVADTLIKERVQTIPGVSTVRIFGEKRYAMRLWLDAERMAAHRITPQDIQRSLGQQNVDLPSGRIEGSSTELGVRTSARLTTPAEFNRITVREEGNRPIRFEDVGFAELGPLNTRFGLKAQGSRMIGVAVVPQPNTNAIAIADEFYRRLEVIKKDIPDDYTVEIGYDFTKYVRKSVREVEETLLIAFVLVAFIIYAFLRDWRSTLIPVIAIPVSIVSSFVFVWLLGFSINVLTLVGIVLSIGLVCDDAIVVLENVYTKVEAGVPPMRAAIEGSKEIFFAIVSTTISLAIVFVPIIFMQGLTGRLFREFAVVVVGSVIISGLIALTLSPMMCRYLLRHGEPGLVYRLTEPFFQLVNRIYGWTLRGFLRARFLAVPILAGVFGLTYFLYKTLPTELAPLEDRSNIRINVRAPEGASAAFTEYQLDQIDTWVTDSVPEVFRTYAILGGFGGSGGVNSGVQNVYLLDGEERTRSQEEIFQQIAKGVGQFSGVRSFPAQPPTIGSRFAGQPLQFVLKAPSSKALIEILPKFLDAAQKRPELRFVDADLKVNRPELAYEVNRERATELGVSVLDVARTLQLGLGGVRYGYFIMNGKQYEVVGQLREADRDDPGDVKGLFVRSVRGEMIPLDALLQEREGATAAALYRFDRYPAATVSAGLTPGNTLGDGIRAMKEVASEVLPSGFQTALAGESRDFADSSSSTTFAFLFALLLVYLVLAAQFESFIDPVIILVTVPLSIAGALGTLYLAQQSLNVFSQIGIVMLVGLVTKNGILVVEFANHHKKLGKDLTTAAYEAAVSRFRPILMTNFASILGVVPIALSLGGAAGSRRSLGIAVAGGLTFSLLLTLYVVPAVYVLLSRRHREEAAEPEHDAATAAAE